MKTQNSRIDELVNEKERLLFIKEKKYKHNAREKLKN